MVSLHLQFRVAALLSDDIDAVFRTHNLPKLCSDLGSASGSLNVKKAIDLYLLNGSRIGFEREKGSAFIER
ncbi:hypothetical protein Hanom_Chr01g00016401 [Helianthus anomalus]